MVLAIPPSSFSTTFAGLGRLKARRVLSGLGILGDTAQLQQAQAALLAAGYSDVTCREERVYFPGIDPQTGQNYYTQQICTAPGFTGGFTVEEVLDSQAQHPGYGVDLAAERRYLMSQPQYSASDTYAFDGAPNTVITNFVGAGGQQTAPPSSGSADQQTYLRAMDAAVAEAAKSQAPAQAQSTNTNTGLPAINVNLTGSAGSGAGLFAGLNSDVLLYGGLAIAGLLVLSMMKK